MTKARTRARRRKARKRAGETAENVVPLAPVPRRQPNGQKRRTPQEADASRQQLDVRAAQAGLHKAVARGEIGMAEAIREVRAPWYGCVAGRAMAAAESGEQARRDLWDAICHIRRVWADYGRAIGAPPRHAQCLRLLLPVDEMHADAASPPADLRTADERYRQAIAAMMQCEGWLGRTDSAAASQCKRAVLDDVPVRDVDGLMRALRCVVDGRAGQARR